MGREPFRPLERYSDYIGTFVLVIGSQLSDLSCEDQRSSGLSGFDVRGENIMMMAYVGG